GFGQYVNDAARVIARLPKRERLQAYYDLAEDLGYVTGATANAMSIDRFSGGDPTSRVQSKLLSSFFRGTRLEQFTNYTTVFAMETGSIFMRRLAKELNAGGKRAENARFHLRDLNIP